MKRRSTINTGRKCEWCREDIIVTSAIAKNKRDKRKYCSLLCANRYKGEHTRGEKSPLWKGGRSKDGNGYIAIKDPRLPHLNFLQARIQEHRYIMEVHLGRKLKKTESVHHKNGIRDDNRIENLELRVSNHGYGATHQHCETCSCFEGVN